MKLRKLLMLLREVEEFSLERGLISDRVLMGIAAILSKQSPAFHRSALRAITISDSRRERFAFYREVLTQAAQQRRRLRSHHPEGGNTRTPPLSRQVTISSSSFRAFASIRSSKKSGMLHEKLYDLEPLRAIELEGTIGNTPAKARFWQQDKAVAFYFFMERDLAFVQNAVFQRAYLGDFRILTLSAIHSVYALGDCVMPVQGQPIPLKQGSNLVCQATVHDTLRQLIPAPLTLFGPYTERQQTANVRLWSAPHFPLTLGHFQLENAFLALSTQFDEAWDAYGSLNAVLPFQGVHLPMSADMPVPGGLLSLNLETSQCPPLSSLAALLPLVDNTPIHKAWGPDGEGFLAAITGYRISELNIFFDIATHSLVSVSLAILIGNEVTVNAVSGKLSGTLSGLSVEWLLGRQGGMWVVTTDGTGKARFSQFGDLEWEVAIVSSPEFCFECWAGFTDAGQSFRFTQWLSAIGAASADQGHGYHGCMIRLYGNRTEVHALPFGAEETRQVFPQRAG